MESHFISCCSSSSFQFWEIPLRVKALTELSSQHAPLYLSAPFFFFPNFDKLPCLSQSASNICPKLTNQRRDQSNWVKRKGKERKGRRRLTKRKEWFPFLPMNQSAARDWRELTNHRKGRVVPLFSFWRLGESWQLSRLQKKKNIK